MAKIVFHKAGQSANLKFLKRHQSDSKFYQSLSYFSKQTAKKLNALLSDHAAQVLVVREGGLLFAEKILSWLNVSRDRSARSVIVIDDICVSGQTLRRVLADFQVQKPDKIVCVLPIITKSIFTKSDFLPWFVSDFPKTKLTIIYGLYQENYFMRGKKVIPGEMITVNGQRVHSIGDFGDFYRSQDRSYVHALVRKIVHVLGPHLYFSRWFKVRLV